MNDGVKYGREAESRAANYLLSIGYTIITRRYRCRSGEIDIICLDGETIVFVEVKARRHRDYAPEASIGAQKITNMRNAATNYMSKFEINRDARFDLVAIRQEEIEHHKDFLGRLS